MDNHVKHARMEQGLTQIQLGKQVGVTRQTISLIEKGQYNPTLRLCLLLSYALHTSLNDLFWIDEEDFK
ncbi:helix-turn-helix transcriptional regulator [Pontibacillus salicampi]|uniref:Helix-turn-helix transcriptional regulator n=1 Tax=Pontibacillus salicampi TaxID=1449801 RepID=A0ABV6LSA8_9BACI